MSHKLSLTCRTRPENKLGLRSFWMRSVGTGRRSTPTGVRLVVGDALHRRGVAMSALGRRPRRDGAR